MIFYLTIKKAECWRTDAFKTLESPLDCKEIKPVNLKGNQLWIFIGRTDAEAEAQVLWPPDAKNWLTGKDWRQEEKGMTEDEMFGWHHRLNVHEFEQALGDGDGQGSVVCCSPWGHKESVTTEQLNNNNNRRALQTTPVFLPGESHRASLEGWSPLGLQRVGHYWAT